MASSMFSYFQNAFGIKIAFFALDRLPSSCLDHGLLVKVVPLSADLLPAFYEFSGFFVCVIPFFTDFDKTGLTHSFAVEIIRRSSDPVPSGRKPVVIFGREVVDLAANILETLQKLSVFNGCIIPF